LGAPKLNKCNVHAVSASGNLVKMLGKFKARINLHGRRSIGDCYVAEPEINVLGSDWIDMLGLWNTPLTSVFNRNTTPLTAFRRYHPVTNRKGQIMTIHAAASTDTTQEGSRNSSQRSQGCTTINDAPKSPSQAASWRSQTAAKVTHNRDNYKIHINSSRQTLVKISGSKFNTFIDPKMHSSKQDEDVIKATSSSRGAAIVKNIHVPSRLFDKVNVKNDNAPGDVR
jgi:hypothetical protein